MIVEQRTYTLRPAGHAEWLKTYEAEGMAAQKEILGHMAGYYFTDIGPLNQIVHMWAYKDLNERAERRKKLFENAQWNSFIPKVRPLLESMESKVLIPAPFFEVPDAK